MIAFGAHLVLIPSSCDLAGFVQPGCKLCLAPSFVVVDFLAIDPGSSGIHGQQP